MRTSGYLRVRRRRDRRRSTPPVRIPDPPREIRSANGKIYVHWHFHRDERQCTPGVHALLHPRQPARAGAGPASRSEPPPEAARRARRRVRRARRRRVTPPPVRRRRRRRPRRPGGRVDDGGLRRLRRFDDSRHRATTRRLDEEVATAEEQRRRRRRRLRRRQRRSRRSRAPAIRRRARSPSAGSRRWPAATPPRSPSLAVLPFKTSGKEVTKRAALTAMLTDLVGRGEDVHAPRTLRALHDRRAARRHRQAARERRRRQRRRSSTRSPRTDRATR